MTKAVEMGRRVVMTLTLSGEPRDALEALVSGPSRELQESGPCREEKIGRWPSGLRGGAASPTAGTQSLSAHRFFPSLLGNISGRFLVEKGEKL